MTNLLKETLEVLKKYGKSPKDVRWIGSRDGRYAITWKEFEKIANVEGVSGCNFASFILELHRIRCHISVCPVHRAPSHGTSQYI